VSRSGSNRSTSGTNFRLQRPFCCGSSKLVNRCSGSAASIFFFFFKQKFETCRENPNNKKRGLIGSSFDNNKQKKQLINEDRVFFRVIFEYSYSLLQQQQKEDGRSAAYLDSFCSGTLHPKRKKN